MWLYKIISVWQHIILIVDTPEQIIYKLSSNRSVIGTMYIVRWEMTFALREVMVAILLSVYLTSPRVLLVFGATPTQTSFGNVDMFARNVAHARGDKSNNSCPPTPEFATLLNQMWFTKLSSGMKITKGTSLKNISKSLYECVISGSSHII